MFWQSISASNNAADFEEYLRQFPKGRFAGLARNRIAAFHPLPNLPPEPETPSTSQQEPQNPAQPAPSPERHQVDVGSSAYEKRDYQTAIRTLLPFAQDGDATAQYYVGLMYLKGQGVPKDDASAVEWLRKSADAGNAYARTYMGAINRRGEIVPRNYQEAMRWYLLAAKQNFKNAQYSIALMYYQGWGVNKDVKQAHVWAVIASSEGEPTFTRFRVQLERQLSDSEIAEGRKKAALWQSQNLGSDVKPAQSSQTR
jgi:TPR repeat protein